MSREILLVRSTGGMFFLLAFMANDSYKNEARHLRQTETENDTPNSSTSIKKLFESFT